jgi:hypothetical protein
MEVNSPPVTRSSVAHPARNDPGAHPGWGNQKSNSSSALKATIGRRPLNTWDGVPAHRSRLVRAFVESTNGAIRLERRPPTPRDSTR